MLKARTRLIDIDAFPKVTYPPRHESQIGEGTQKEAQQTPTYFVYYSNWGSKLPGKRLLDLAVLLAYS